MKVLTGNQIRRIADWSGLVRDAYDPAERLRLLLQRRPHNPQGEAREPDIYFLQSEGPGGEIKIGLSGWPLGRQRALHTSSPYRLKFVGLISEGGAGMEGELHGRFAHLRMNGEWFRPGADLWAYIESLEAHI